MHGRPASPRTVLQPDFRLYHSNALEVLAGLLAEQVARVPADGDWLRPDVVLVPQFSMRRWLQQALAEHSGICANLRFVTPGEFVDGALDANLAPALEADRLAPAVLRWHLLRELDTAPPPRLAGFVNAAEPLKAWTLATALADTYEKYQAWRRDLLQRWERGMPDDQHDWQATLWRRIARNRAHRARRIGEYLQRFGGGGADAPAGLPPRLFVFACQNVSPDVLQVIASQARAGEQHFYLHTPARAFWGDPQWGDLRSWAANYAPADDDAFLGGIEDDGGPNPLLAAWGQAGRDFIAALGSGEAVHASFESVAFAEPPRDTLLGRLQADVLDNSFINSSFINSSFIGNDSAPAGNDASAWPRAQVDRGDASLQFHACHTRLREVQVLHDQLRALLEQPGSAAQPQLQPRDIAVLAPDIDLYAPHIEAVFGGALGSARELPYTIADASPLASAPLAEAFIRLLELPLRPLTVGDVVDLLAVPALAARFGIDDEDRDAVQRWLEEAGARWGLDRADRARHGAADDDVAVDGAALDGAYTFEFALDRLLLGYAAGSDDDIAGIAPWPGLEGQAATALDALLRFLSMLRDAATRLAGPHPPATWARDLERLLDSAFAVERDSADAAVLKRLRECVAGFARSAALADYATPVEHALVLAHVREELARSDARAPFLSGGICFGRMVPMRLIPFRAICLLGLDDGAFPARDGGDPLNRIAQQLDTRQRRIGDPSRRDADRYLFLQLFASAGRVLYLSWCGMDPRDGSEREPSALVSELLDAAAQYHLAGDGEARAAVRSALVLRHALQPFSPAAFGAPLVDEEAIEPRRFSYDPRWRDARVAATDSAPPPFATAPLPRETPVGAVLATARLHSALNKPHRAYLRDGLGLRLPEEEPPLAEHEPFGKPDPLARWALRNLAFEHWLCAGRRPDPRALHAHLLARAQVAPGADGRASVEALLADVAPFACCALDAGFTAAARTQPLEQAAGTRVLQGTLADVRSRHGRDGVLRVALRPEGRHGGHALRHGLDWLLASLHDLPLYEILSDKGEDPRLQVREPLQDKTQVVASLETLLALREQALRAPLPFLPKSGFEYVQALRDAQARPGDDGAAVAAAMEKARRRWCGDDNGGVGEAGADTRLALRGRDPFADGDPAGRARFQRIARELFGAFAQQRPIDAEALS